MFGMKSVRSSARGGVSRAGGSVILSLWCLLSLVSGAGQALCLELGGGCSMPAAAAGCHAEAPESGLDPGCGSCVDVLVPDEASARCGRPDHDVRPVAEARAPAAADHIAVAALSAVPMAAAPLPAADALHHSVRSTVLLI